MSKEYKPTYHVRIDVGNLPQAKRKAALKKARKSLKKRCKNFNFIVTAMGVTFERLD